MQPEIENVEVYKGSQNGEHWVDISDADDSFRLYAKSEKDAESLMETIMNAIKIHTEHILI